MAKPYQLIGLLYSKKHRRKNITVRGFVLEHAANQWDDFFWIARTQAHNPSPAAFAQGGLLSTRSGHDWLVEQ